MNGEFVEQMQSIQERPLSNSEIENLKKYVVKYGFSIKQRLQRKHYIYRHMEILSFLFER